MAGGLRSGISSTIRDELTGLTIRQIIPPPISAKADDFEAELKGRIDIEDRMTYTHRPISGRGFGILQMKVEELVKKKSIEEQALADLNAEEENIKDDDEDAEEKSKNDAGEEEKETGNETATVVTDDFMAEDDFKGVIDTDLWSVDNANAMNLGAKLTRLPTWLRRTVQSAMERDNMDEDDENNLK